MKAIKIPVLMYHSICDLPYGGEDVLCVGTRRFARQMEYLHRAKYTPVSLDALERHLSLGASLPERPVAITFDDGYQDNFHNALPILAQYGFPATIFLVTNSIGLTSTWDGTYGRILPLLNWSEIFEMTKFGVEFGSHTKSHPRLDSLTPPEIKDEIIISKTIIEQKIGVAVRHFSYPYGVVPEIAPLIVAEEAGYTTACTTCSGFNSRTISPFAIRRLDVYGSDTLSNFTRKLTYGTNDGSFATSIRYYGGRIMDAFGKSCV